MQRVWYYAVATRPIGPLTLQQLKTAIMQTPNWRETLVWRNGYQAWVWADSIPELTANQDSSPQDAMGPNSQQPPTDMASNEDATQEKSYSGFEASSTNDRISGRRTAELSQRPENLLMTHAIRFLGYVVTGLGACLFLASYMGTYMRGGAHAVFERFFNPSSDLILGTLCLIPGILLLTWAWERAEKNPTDD